VRIIDPYREKNERVLRWLASRTLEEKLEMLKKIGILDKRGNLAPKYRTPKAPKAAKPRSAKATKAAKPGSAKAANRKRAAS
jgi:hypothetical protein